MYKIKDMDESYRSSNLNHIASSYQEAIVDTLLDRIEKISKEENIDNISIAGGVAANTRFRYKAEQLSLKMDLKIHFPAMKLCTDNAGMIAMAGYEKLSNNLFSTLDLEAQPNLSL